MDRSSPRIALLLVLLATTLLYSPVAGFDFVNWDDDYYILRDEAINQGWSRQGLVYAFTAAKPYVMPITRLFFMTEVELFGLFPGGFHLVGLLLHLANVWLVGWLLWRLTGAAWKAVAVAALFALHPQRVEAVAWVTEQKELLSTFFALLAVLGYGGYARGQRHGLLLALAAMLASLLVKPTWVVAPILLLLLDFWPLQRLERGWRALLGEKWPFFALSFLFSLVTLAGFAMTNVGAAEVETPVTERLTQALQALALYLGNGLWPVELAAYRPRGAETTPLLTMAGGAALVLLTTLFWRWRRQKPYGLMGWLWFLALLTPVSGLFTQEIVVTTTDRWTYGAHLGLAVALVWWIGESRPRNPWPGVALLLCVLGGWWSGSRATLAHWQDSTTLWRSVTEILQDDPGSSYGHGMLGKYWVSHGQHQRAVGHFLEAARRNPHFPFYALEAGNAYLHSGQTARAWQWYHRLADIPLTPPALLLDVGRLAIQNGQYEEAARYWPHLERRFGPNQREERAATAFMSLLTRLAMDPATPVDHGIVTAYLTTATPPLRCQQALQLLTTLAQGHRPVQEIARQVVPACQALLLQE